MGFCLRSCANSSRRNSSRPGPTLLLPNSEAPGCARTACPALTGEGCKAGHAWERMSIPEAANPHSHLQGRVESPIQPSPGERRFSGSQCHFRWEKLRGNSFALRHRPRTHQPMRGYCQHWRLWPKCSENLQEAPPSASVENNYPSKSQRKDGDVLGCSWGNVQAAHRTCPMRTRLQNFVVAPSSEPGPPPSRLSQPLGDVRGQAVRRGLGRDPATPLCVWGYWAGVGDISVHI